MKISSNLNNQKIEMESKQNQYFEENSTDFQQEDLYPLIYNFIENKNKEK